MTITPVLRWTETVRRWWRAHPRVGLAMRTAIAGGLAWGIAQLLPVAEVDRYVYFAPMGAVIVTSMSVVGTLRELLRAIGALVLGAGLGLAATAVADPTMLSIAAVVAVSVLAAGWARLGTMRGWVPTVAIFTLILGRGQPWIYATAYIGLSTLGAAVGAAVVALLPQLLVEPLDTSASRMWSMAIERLRHIRDDLRRGEEVQSVDTTEYDLIVQQFTSRLNDATDAGRINRRSRKDDLEVRVARARAILAMAQRLQAFRRQLVEHQADDRPSADGALGPAFGGLIDLLIQAMEKQSNDDLDSGLDRALNRADEAARSVPDGAPGRHTASASVLELRQLAVATQEAVERSRQ